MFDFTIAVSRKQWMQQPAIRWQAGLDAAGFNFRQGLQRAMYPPLPPSGDRRQYQTADKAGWNVEEFGKSITFGSTYYLPFILDGTRKWEGWPGKWAELQDLMQRGFKAGVRDFNG